MKLSEEVRKNSEEYELQVFRNFISKLMSLQKEFDDTYHGDRLL